MLYVFMTSWVAGPFHTHTFANHSTTAGVLPARNRARQRHLIQSLKEEYTKGGERSASLQRENDILRAQIATLKEQSHLLVSNHVRHSLSNVKH